MARTARPGSFSMGLLLGCALGAAAVVALSTSPGPFRRWLSLASIGSVAGLPSNAPKSFAEIYREVSPAVVSVYASTQQRAVVEFPFGEMGLGPSRRALSSGSGFLISADGYVVTNHHVIARSQSVNVVFADGRSEPARLVGTDPRVDLAILKIDGGTYKFVNFAASSTPRVGDWVIAVGNPFGLGATATAGIVSAYGRNIGAPVDFLQLDAPINQGNSGGPTFDAQGRVVGVNTAIASPTGASVGIGFAIPADVAFDTATRIIEARGGRLAQPAPAVP